MKKTIVLTVLSICLCITAYAQVSFGVKAGMGFSSADQFRIGSDLLNITFPDKNVSNELAFYAGVTADFPVYKSLTLETGVFFAPRKLQGEADAVVYADMDATVINSRSVYDVSLQTTYIDIPVMVKMPNELVTPYAGITASILISNEYSYSHDYYDYEGGTIVSSSSDSYTSDIADCLHPLVLNASFGIEIPVMKALKLDIRYVMGLTTVEKTYALDSAEFNEIIALPENQRIKWAQEHPFIAYPIFPDGEDYDSIHTSALYFMIGYTFK